MTATKFRTWDELTSGERWDIMHAENPPSLKQAFGLLWRITDDGWECKDREQLNPNDIFGCR